MLLKLVEWYAKRKGKQAAKEFENDPEVKKEIEELDATWEEFEEKSNDLGAKIDAYMEKHKK